MVSNLIMVLGGSLVLSTAPVYAEPVLQVTPESLDFEEVEAYSTTVKTEQVTISNCGDGVLCWGVAANDGWLSVEGDTSGMIDLPNGDSKYTQVSLGACGLCAAILFPDDITGEHEGTFTVYHYDYDDSGTDPICTTDVVENVIVAASMMISEYNVLEASPDEINFGEVSDKDKFEITNAGEGNMEWEASVSEGVSWLTIEGGSGDSGIIVSGSTKTVSVEVDRSSIEGCAGEYYTFIKVISPNAMPDEVTINVTMETKIIPPDPSSPTPDDGAVNQSLYTTLKWQEGASRENVGGIVYFDVYFSTDQALVDSNSPSMLVCDDTEVPYCDPNKGGGALDAYTTYYWKVNAADECQDNTISSDVWSFTTGAEPEPTCPLSLLLPLNNSELTTLRRFRDEVLAKSFEGERYVDLYYSPHAIEALLILLFNPELRVCAGRIVEESLPAIQSLLRGERVSVDSEIRADIELFLEEFGKDASPDLKRAMGIIRKDIAARGVFKGFGFSAAQ